jgi:CheY-like chemotaxis protein
VKFTLKGDVVLEARLHHGERGPVFKASVSDTGVGMSQATLAVLFEPFRQGEEGSARRFAGSGLGLAICRELVQAMGGRIEVRSTEGRGSIFDVEWPLRPVTEGPMNPGSKPSEPLGRVLIVDPHEPSALGLTALVARMGYSAVRCRTAAQLRSALAGRDAHGRSPWVMAATDDMGSLSILEQATTALNPARMIGIHRSQALDAQRRGEADEGTHNPLRLTRTLTRPVLRATLTALLDADLPNESTDDAPPESPSMHTDLQDPALPRSKAQHRGQVLLAEDDRTNQLIVRAMLESAGFEVTVAEHGMEALRLVEQQRFDVVLMDWQMPGMDGLEVTRRMRLGDAGAWGRQVPVVALTANAFIEDRDACLAVGMDDFLSKPVVVPELLATLRRWVHKGHARARGETESPTRYSTLS